MIRITRLRMIGIGLLLSLFTLFAANAQAIEGEIDLAKYKGKVVYVDFWASWCGPCKQSFPWMAEMQRKYASLGLEIVAVNVDRKRTDAERFLAGTPAAFTVVFDAAGATPNAWNVRAMPSSYLVDRQGRVVHVDQGFREDMKAPIEARIRATLEAAR